MFEAAPETDVEHMSDDNIAKPKPGKWTIAVQFTIEGDLRFISHHDTIRMWARAVARAGLPVSHSQGFNPKPYISLPLPRPLAVASDCELALIGVRESLLAEEVRGRLSRVMPTGVRLVVAANVPTGAKLKPVEVTYDTELDADDSQRVGDRLAPLLAESEVWIDRDSGPDKPRRRIDVRPYIRGIERVEETLRIRLNITQDGAARPGEILALLGLAAEDYLHRTRRASVAWNPNLLDG